MLFFCAWKANGFADVQKKHPPPKAAQETAVTQQFNNAPIQYPNGADVRYDSQQNCTYFLASWVWVSCAAVAYVYPSAQMHDPAGNAFKCKATTPATEKGTCRLEDAGRPNHFQTITERHLLLKEQDRKS